MLPHAAVGFRRPGNALQLRLASLRVALPADQRHIAVLDSAFEAQHAVGIVADPELMPALRLRVPGVVADAVAAFGTGPVLGNAATIGNGFNQAVTHDDFAARIAHLPAADPEIELVIFGERGGAAEFRWRCRRECIPSEQPYRNSAKGAHTFSAKQSRIRWKPRCRKVCRAAQWVHAANCRCSNQAVA